MSFKRVLIVGCSHGIYADDSALAAVLKFKAAWKPQITVHLGDAVDCTAFMGSHLATGDGDPIIPDVDGGLEFINELRPQFYLAGNHEDRLLRLTKHRNEFISYAAHQVLNQIQETCNRLHCRWADYTGNDQAVMLGNVRLMHGTVYNEQAIRDHAEMFAPAGGSVVHAHTHRPGSARGRRHDGPIGFCVGTLTRRSALDYAKCRRATLGWGQAFVWGVIDETRKTSQLWLHEKTTEQWILPG